MAVAFDAATESERTGTTDPHTFSHTGRASGSGGVQGVIVAVVHGTTATPHAVSATYGGVALERVVTAADTVTEPGRADLWFAGSGLTGGTQTVSVDLDSGTTDDIHFVAITLTASTNIEVVDAAIISANVANPSVTLEYQGRTCISIAAFYGGNASPADFAVNANTTSVADFDLGNFYSVVMRQTTPGTSDFAIGGTAVSDDVAFAAACFSEVVTAGTFPAYDLFTGSDGTALPNHTPDTGGRWRRLAVSSNTNAATITSNRIAAAGNGRDYRLTTTPASAVYDVACDFNPGSDVSISPSIRLYGRADAEGVGGADVDYYTIIIVASSTDTTYIMQKNVAGTTTQLDSVTDSTAKMVASTTYRVVFEMSTALKACYVDGVRKSSSTNDDITQTGRSGVLVPPSTNSAYIDNFMCGFEARAWLIGRPEGFPGQQQMNSLLVM